MNLWIVYNNMDTTDHSIIRIIETCSDQSVDYILWEFDQTIMTDFIQTIEGNTRKLWLQFDNFELIKTVWNDSDFDHIEPGIRPSDAIQRYLPNYQPYYEVDNINESDDEDYESGDDEDEVDEGFCK